MYNAAVEDNIEECGLWSASSTDPGSNVFSDTDLLCDLEQVYQSKLWLLHHYNRSNVHEIMVELKLLYERQQTAAASIIIQGYYGMDVRVGQ